jgi:DNA-binding beta-propeller fold protein YncE
VNRRELLAAAVALPIAAALAPDALARRLGGTPLALVTADTESHVAAIDLSTGEVAGRVATLPGPRSVESVAGRVAVVAHTTYGAVTLLDGPSLSVRHVLDGFDEPRYTAAHPDGRHAYVTDSGSAQVVVLDVVAGRIVGRLGVDGPARHASIDRTGRMLWVALGSKARELVLLDVSSPGRPSLVERLRPPYLAHDVGFAPSGRRVWVTSGDRGTIGIFDARTRRLASAIPAGTPPQHVTFAGGRAFVTSGEDGTLHVHDLSGGRLLRETAVPAGSYNVQSGWGRILTPSLDRGTLCVLSARGRLLERVQVAPSSHDACFVLGA